MKTYKTILTVVIATMFLQTSFAQDKQRVLVLFGGKSTLARQDLVYSPFVHNDLSGISFGLNYQQEKKYFQFLETGFTVNSAQVGEPYEMDMEDHAHMIMPHEFLNLHLSYGIGKRILDSSKKTNWIGGSIRTDLQAGFYDFALSNMFGYFINQSINIWYLTSYSFTAKHHLSFRAELPLLSWISRPPYLAEDDEFIENISSHNSAKIIMAFIGDGKFTTWDRLQRVILQANYTYDLTMRYKIGVEYRFDFIHTSIPKTLLSYQNQINLTGIIKF